MRLESTQSDCGYWGELSAYTGPSRRPGYTWTCVLCRPSPELPFHFVRFLGWSTRHLALDPSSLLYLQRKLCSYLGALQHLPPPQPVPRQALLPLRHVHSSLSHGFTRRASLYVLALRIYGSYLLKKKRKQLPFSLASIGAAYLLGRVY
jgi:hypothetical protein